MHFVKKLMKLRVGHHPPIWPRADEIAPSVEMVADFGLVHGLRGGLSVSEPVTP